MLDGVRIANAPWADARRPFAALEQVVFQLAWHRQDGRWVVTRMILRDGEVHLARQADGRRNWRLRNPEDRGPGRFWFQALEPHGVALTFVHDGVDLDLRTRASALAADAAAGGDALVNRIDFDGSWRGVAFKGSADTGPELTFFESGRWFPARGHVEAAGVRFEADGRAADLFRGLRIDAATGISGDSLAGLGPVLGARPTEPRAFAPREAGADEGEYAITAPRPVGATDLAGDVSGAARRAPFAEGDSAATQPTGDCCARRQGGSAPPPEKARRAVAVAAAASSVAARDAFAGPERSTPTSPSGEAVPRRRRAGAAEPQAQGPARRGCWRYRPRRRWGAATRPARSASTCASIPPARRRASTPVACASSAFPGERKRRASPARCAAARRWASGDDLAACAPASPAPSRRC